MITKFVRDVEVSNVNVNAMSMHSLCEIVLWYASYVTLYTISFSPSVRVSLLSSVNFETQCHVQCVGPELSLTV